MKIDDSFVSIAFLTIQIVGMAGLYLYYNYKNKKAEKTYWERLGQEV